MNPKVNFYFEKESKFQEEIQYLREICLKTSLEENLKWGVPCYSMGSKNVVLIHYFKNYCALLFMKGVLMKDEKSILVQQTEHVRAARQLRFENLTQIKEQEKSISQYIKEAIEIEKAGLSVDMRSMPVEIADEFQTIIDENKNLKVAFENLTPGRQREYIIFFKNAKQSKTRINRIEKYIPKIMAGKGKMD